MRHAMSYNPGTGLAYIPALDLAGGYGEETIDKAAWEFSTDFRFMTGTDPGVGDVPADAGGGPLKAWPRRTAHRVGGGEAGTRTAAH